VDKFSTVSHSIISGLNTPNCKLPSNRDIPLFVGIPEIMNHRVPDYRMTDDRHTTVNLL